MLFGVDYRMLLWAIPVMVIALVLGRTLWVFRGSRNWPTADGTITCLEVQRVQRADGHYSCATFTYGFLDLQGHKNSSTWYKNFSTEVDARDIAALELPVGKQVQVRFNPKDPAVNELELDSFAYTNDRPTSLDL
jgi:hypothetical protein